MELQQLAKAGLSQAAQALKVSDHLVCQTEGASRAAAGAQENCKELSIGQFVRAVVAQPLTRALLCGHVPDARLIAWCVQFRHGNLRRGIRASLNLRQSPGSRIVNEEAVRSPQAKQPPLQKGF